VVPTTVAGTWTVNITSLTVNWTNGANPANVTKYIVELSTVSGFGSGTTVSSTTYNLSGIFINLIPDATYYGQVKALNHYDIETAYLALGSTKTNQANAPTGLAFTSATVSSLTASWNASSPAGNSYTLQVSTDSSFNGTITSSNTAGLSAVAD